MIEKNTSDFTQILWMSPGVGSAKCINIMMDIGFIKTRPCEGFTTGALDISLTDISYPSIDFKGSFIDMG